MLKLSIGLAIGVMAGYGWAWTASQNSMLTACAHAGGEVVGKPAVCVFIEKRDREVRLPKMRNSTWAQTKE